MKKYQIIKCCPTPRTSFYQVVEGEKVIATYQTLGEAKRRRSQIYLDDAWTELAVNNQGETR